MIEFSAMPALANEHIFASFVIIEEEKRSKKRQRKNEDDSLSFYFFDLSYGTIIASSKTHYFEEIEIKFQLEIHYFISAEKS